MCLFLVYIGPFQSEDLDDDTWTKSMAAGSCLGLLAQSVQSDVVQPPSPVLPFIEANIQNANWRFKEAAVMAFGMLVVYVWVCSLYPEPRSWLSLSK